MRQGQVMVLTIMVLGGIMIGASAIGGLLTLFQMREATDTTNSTQAIYAADTGVEWELYKFTNPDEAQEKGEWSMTNGAEFVSSITMANTSTPSSVKSIGTSGNSHRAFEVVFSGGSGANPPAGSTYSYVRQTSVIGYKTPRCVSCDNNISTQNCAATFIANEADPNTCYDQYTTGNIWKTKRSMPYDKVQN